MRNLWESLAALGVSKVSDEERVDLLLTVFETTDDQHLEYMNLFLQWWGKNREDTHKFRDCAIFRSAENVKLHKAEECFIDSPLQKTGLQIIYRGEYASNSSSMVKLWSGYQELTKEGFCEFAISCGVVNKLPIQRDFTRANFSAQFSFPGLDKSGRYSVNQIDKDYTIPNLAKLLKCNNIEINMLVWNSVIKADPETFVAMYRTNAQCGLRVAKSSFIFELTKAKWIPDKRGRLHQPGDMTEEQLHNDFKYDNHNGWLDAIGFAENVKD